MSALSLDAALDSDGVSYTAGTPADINEGTPRRDAMVTVRIVEAANTHPAYKLAISASVTDAATPPNAYVPILDTTPDDGTVATFHQSGAC